MACGCPVIASRAASIPEVCGDAVLYFDPYDPAALAQAIEKIVDNPSARKELCIRGARRAAQLSWQESASVLLNEIGRVS